MKRFTLATLVIVLAASLAPAQQAARRIIETNTKKFIESFNKGDAAAVADMYTTDARLLPPNGPMVEGRAEIQKFWQGAIGAGLKLLSLEPGASGNGRQPDR